MKRRVFHSLAQLANAANFSPKEKALTILKDAVMETQVPVEDSDRLSGVSL